VPQNTNSTHFLDNLHCMLPRIPAENCIRDPLKSLLKSSIIFWSVNLPRCQGSCLEDPVIHLISNHLLNASSEPGSSQGAEERKGRTSVNWQFLSPVGSAIVQVTWCPGGEEGHPPRPGWKGPAREGIQGKWLRCHPKDLGLWAKSSGKERAGPHKEGTREPEGRQRGLSKVGV